MDRDRRTRTGARAPGVEQQKPLERRCSSAQRPPAQNGDPTRAARSTKDAGKLFDAKVASHGKALSDRPALKPYRGKPAVRNFREGDGNVGIIRSPLRAIVLPDYGKGLATHTGPESCAVAREGEGEALTGGRAGQVLSREIHDPRREPWPLRG